MLKQLIEKNYNGSLDIDELNLRDILKRRKLKDERVATATRSQKKDAPDLFDREGSKIKSRNNASNVKVTTKHRDYSKDEVNFKSKQTYVLTEADILDRNKRARDMLPHVILYFENLPLIRDLYLKDNHKKLIDLEMLDLSASLANNVHLIDTYVHSITFSGEHAIHTETLASLFHKILKPPKFDYTLYGYDSVSQMVVQPKYRYIGNHDLESIRRVAALKLEDKKHEPAIVANAVLKMFEELSDQNRFGNLYIYIKILIEMKQLHSDNQYHSVFSKIVSPVYNKRITSEDTISFQALIFLLKQFKTFPFRIKDGVLKMRVSGEGFSTSIPNMIYTLINNTTNELCGNLSRSGALTALYYLCECSSSSLVTSYLNYKSASRSWFKYFLDKIPRAAFINYATSGEPNDVVIDDMLGEHFRTGESRELVIPEEIPSMMKVYIQNRMNEAKRISKNESPSYYYGVTEYIRFVFMEMNVITNPSLFFKTSLVLEYEKSIQTRIKKPISVLGPRQFAYEDDREMPFAMKYQDDLLFKLETTFDQIYGQTIIDRFNSGVNWEAEFVIALTNKSGGIKSTDQTMTPLLRSISNTRLLNFVTGIQEFTNVRDFTASLTLESRCAIRYQNDRRSRLIVIVPNSIQSSEIFLLYVFNKIKMIPGSTMFVGKTVGDIRDVVLQLCYSSRQTSLKNNSDISGMDAHTLPVLSDFIRYLVLKYLLKYDTNNREYFSTSKQLMRIYTDIGGIIEETMMVPASALHSAKVMRDMRTLQLQIPDRFFGISMNSTDETFMSGLYGTSAQHTILLDVLMRVVYEDYKVDNPRTFIPINRIMGDDRFEVIPDARNHEANIEKYLQLTDEYLSRLNYSQDADTSYFHAKFLQQNGLLGVFAPLVSRTSVWTAERSDTVHRQPLDAISILANVVNTYAQRSYSIENAQQLLVAIWNNLRCHSIYVNDSNKAFITQLKKRNSKFEFGVDNFLVDDGFGKVKIKYPFVTIFVAPIGWPMTAFIDEVQEKQINPGSATTMAGDYSKIVLSAYFNSHKDFKVADLNFHDMQHWDERASYGFTFGEYLMKFTRARILSTTREEALRTNIVESSAVLEKYLDPVKKAKSIAAMGLLREKRIRVTEGISYIGQPKAKIKQALASRLESLPETSLLDNKFLYYLTKFKIIPNEDELLKHSICGLEMDYVIDRNKLLPEDGVTAEGAINSKLPLLPGYHKYSSYGKLLVIGATPLSAGKTISGSIAAISAELGATYDVESAVRFGAAVLNQRGNMKIDEILNIVCDVMGLSVGARPYYHQLVLEYNEVGAYTEYQTIFDNVKFFCISGNVELFKNLYTVEHNRLIFQHARRFERYFKIMIRDAYFASIDYRNYDDVIKLKVPLNSALAMLPERLRMGFRR